MNFAKNIFFSFLLLLAVGLPAAAQEPAGKFTVAHETRWGTAMLPAGNYVVSLHSGPVPYVIVTSENSSPVSIMAVARYLETADCKTSSLQLEESGGAWNVRSLCFQSQTAVYFGRGERLSRVRAKAEPQIASLSGSN